MEKIDFCHICGVKQKMSYEYIPPHSAFNWMSRKMVSLNIIDVNNDEDEIIMKKRYKQF